MTSAPTCRFCRSELRDQVLDLGLHPFSNAYLRPGAQFNERRYPLRVWVCAACLLVQTDYDAPAAAIFAEDYAYFSSMSASWVAHAARYADAMTRRFGLDKDSLVVEAASNDGYLLQHFAARGIPVLGVEPTKGTAQAAIDKGVRTHVDFFGESTARALLGVYGGADLMAANNVLAHVPDIADFVKGFSVLLKRDGVATFEFPHVQRLLQDVQFDTIYHEHYSYLSLAAVERVFGGAGLKVVDVEELPTHGGSLRVFAARTDSARAEGPSVGAIRAQERAAGLDSPAGYMGLATKVAGIRDAFLGFLDRAEAEGKSVAGYGAAAKGNTFLNYCGVGAPRLLLVADKAPSKQGLLLPGSHIPVVSPETLLKSRPDYVVILPWNLRDEISLQLLSAPEWGGKFVTAIPHLVVF
jgi:SAM-dependent methyltransferase